MDYLQPQLPPLQRPHIVSHSEAEAAARCSLQHQLGYRERWSRPFNPGSAAGRGIAWHEVMEAHYRVIQSAQLAQEAAGRPWWTFDQTAALGIARTVVDGIIDRFEAIDEELGGLLAWMYAGYVQQWGADPDWRILEVERAGVVPLAPPGASLVPSVIGPFPRLGSAITDFHFKYRIDLLVEENGRIWLVDHKSVANFPSQMDLDFDSQVDRYTWALQLEGFPVYGAIFSQARRKMLKRAQTLDERHRRPRTHRTPRELNVIAEDLFETIYARYDQQSRVEWNRSATPGHAGQVVVPTTVPPADSPRSTSSRHCSFLCDFTEACLAGRKGADSRQYLVEEGFRQNFDRH